MKFSWFFNGTLEAHDLAAVYLTVLVIQGGYAAWIAWQWGRTRSQGRTLEPLPSATPKER
jgi:hypothetical protein